ncbi:hypothetical protein HanRHA438_Chr14g0653921 [Helianthus annuus]|nr:hypothetical protein HanRHA438_Chr14g0653921 [Helianthus annuus]
MTLCTNIFSSTYITKPIQFAKFLQIKQSIRILKLKTATCNAGGNEPSESAFNDSEEDDLSVGLVDSPSAGQAAPITGLTTSTTPLENLLFHTGFLKPST